MSLKKESEEIIEPKDIFVGKKEAPVVLMEFGEYESEECARANEIVKQILENYDGKVKLNFRHFPQTRIHQRSLKAAESAIAAAQEGKFWEMHNVLFQNRRNLGTTSLKLHSKEAGVNNKNFLEELVNGTYGWQVQDDLKYGIDLGVKEVPTFFVNGQMVKGKTTYALLSQAIDEALKGVKKKPVDKAKAKPKAEPKPEPKPEPKAPVKTAAKAPVKTKTKAK
ncbi:DsbA family protein [Niabella pedocola]|uniref:DsbA family protein n=1 Tax=Niabella pedocola TaxID=1752077 RepID=A0ABS8PZD4_9BACT|nr:thioredoxin domain-containing protein [Niabella pedocola]MCD2425693.1 DsbA family protein [Niabella pedocola]